MLYPAYTSISDILRDYFRANPSPIDLNRLTSTLIQSLNFVATVDKISGSTGQPAESQITLAGYREGYLYISQVFFVPAVVNGRVECTAHSQKEKLVKSGLIFATAGIDRIARASLDNPAEAAVADPFDGRALKVRDSMMDKLSAAKLKNDGVDLSVEDLTELARDLEVKTAKAYRNEVGDDVETAVLFDGRVQSFQQPVDEHIDVNKLPYMKISGAAATGVSFGISESSYTLMECSSLAAMPISLDGSLFLGDSFSRCHLIYRGAAQVFFDRSNVVVDSELDLGPSVRDDDAFVVRMKSLYPGLQIKRISGLT